MHILSRLAYTRHIRQLCLLQGTDEPLSPRHPVQHVAILQIAPVAEATVIGRRDHQVLARIDGPKKTFLEVRAKTIIVPDIGNEEPRTSLGERIGQRGNRDYPDIVHAKPCSRKRHVVTCIQVKILELKPPSRRLTFLRIAVRKPALFYPIVIL